MQVKSKLINSNQSWNAKRRYKINAVVEYNGDAYQNSTGINSEPGIGNDWIKTNLNDISVHGDGLEFTANGTDNFIDIGVSQKPMVAFLDSALLRKGDWSFSGTTVTFMFTPDLNAIIQFI